MSTLTEQEKRQFEQTVAKVTRVGQSAIAQTHYAEQAISFYESVHYNLDQVVQEAFNTEPKAQCQSGCAHCCKHRRVEVSMPEAFYIAEQIKKLPEATQSEIIKRLTEAVETLKQQPTVDDCSFLQDNRCMIYQVRPSVCRKAHSQDMSACEEDKDIPQHLGVLLGVEAMLTGTQQAYENLGYPAQTYELNTIMHTALTDASMLVEWYKVHLEAVK